MQKKKKKPAFRRPAFWLTILLVAGALTAGWWLWHCTYATSHRLNYILITVNGEPQKILSGEAVSLHPNDKVKILNISTNIPFNLDIRLTAKGFDVGALQYEETPLSALLPGQEIFDHYRFRIRLMYRSEDLAYVDWDIRPYAEDWLDRADRIIDKEKRLAFLERAVRLLPKDSRIKQRLLGEYKAQKLWKQVAGMLEHMAAKEPDRETLIELLDAYTAMQSKDRIISVLKRIVKLDPDDPEARYRLAEVLEGEGKLKEAIREYGAVLKRVDKKGADAETGIRSAELCKHLGYLCTETGYFKKAISFYLKAVSLDRKDANVYYNLSYLYEKIHQKEKSELYLDKALRLKSGDVESRLKLARGLMEKGDLKKAGKYLEEVLHKKPKSLDALLLMAQLMEKQGEKQGLRKIYKRILLLEPENETVIYNLGGLLYETGDLKG
ncbi:MAG: tetratricopeptide repeat protein, partial [Deltaproteobacteria bacterium]|nr:tetratricopeptide repeat protein [Deltaproteobacteria bacterium]